MINLTAATVFFLGIHLGIAGTRFRDVLTSRLGEMGYRGLFSVLSLVGISWMVMAWGDAAYTELWGQLYVLKIPAMALTFIAFWFVVVGLTTPSPTSAGTENLMDKEDAARGILRITRHPFLWGVAIWALTHLIVNGDLAALVFFGGLLVLCLTGTASIDEKRARLFGDRWEGFASRTSNVPFAAIAAGRNTLEVGELLDWRLAVAVVVYGAVLWFHAWLFGVPALP